MLISELINKEFNNEKCYVLVYKISNVELTEFNGLLHIDDFHYNAGDVLELFIFNKDKEVKYRKGTELVVSSDSADYVLEEVYLNNTFKSKYTKLVVRNNLEYSEDGIIYVKSNRFVEVK